MAVEKFARLDLEFSINITAQDLHDKGFLEHLCRRIGDAGIARERVVLEILEDDSFLSELGRIERLKKLGFKIAIDDFGVGYSNFSKLQKLGADYIKIDGSLIKNLDRNENDREILKTILSYAKSIGARTIAEFVASEEIFAAIRALGVDYAQGYFIGRPAEALQ